MGQGWGRALSLPVERGNLVNVGPWGLEEVPYQGVLQASCPYLSSGYGHAWAPKACASGACCPEHILTVPERGEGDLILGVLGWAPSCCGLNLERDQDWGPSCLLETAPGPGRDRAEGSLPWGDQEWTFFRGMWESVAAASTNARPKEDV